NQLLFKYEYYNALGLLTVLQGERPDRLNTIDSISTAHILSLSLPRETTASGRPIWLFSTAVVIRAHKWFIG
ncbi:hypothetical protein ACJX0J_011611, partial [Zea mays]